MLSNAVGTGVRLALVVLAAYMAYDIRLYAIKTYGRLIHEFDPWFNFHATRYLFENGMEKFFKWFDHTAWYPLGRPVGTTIYPGMQLTSVGLYYVLEAIGLPMSLNDICVFVPSWFGALATVMTGFLAAECSRSKSARPAAALVMAIIPAHIMRSVGGGYDNESIAVTAMATTFYFWCRSLRDNGSWPYGIVAGLAHIYMVAAWGGYVFVINMIGVSAAALMMVDIFIPRGWQKFLFSDLNFENTLKAYTCLFIVGTAGAVQVPVVGWTPIKSMEQIGPLLVFCAYQVCHPSPGSQLS
jgi:dolichyl-diphosphooligosaccharide--protein glycosyltransferase